MSCVLNVKLFAHQEASTVPFAINALRDLIITVLGSTLLLIILLIVTSSVIMIVDECAPDKNSSDCPLIELCVGCKILWLRYLMLAVTTLICIFFGFPATLLCSVHLKNYYYGKTTNERFAKNARADSVISETLGSVADLRDVLNEEDISSD